MHDRTTTYAPWLHLQASDSNVVSSNQKHAINSFASAVPQSVDVMEEDGACSSAVDGDSRCLGCGFVFKGSFGSHDAFSCTACGGVYCRCGQPRSCHLQTGAHPPLFQRLRCSHSRDAARMPRLHRGAIAVRPGFSILCSGMQVGSNPLRRRVVRGDALGSYDTT